MASLDHLPMEVPAPIAFLSTRHRTFGRAGEASQKNLTCTIEISWKFIEPEALADFQWRGSASALGSMNFIGKFKLNRTDRKNLNATISIKRGA